MAESQRGEDDVQKPSLALSRSRFHLAILSALVLPTLIVSGFAAEVRGIFFVALLSMVIGAGGTWYLLRLWELKMQRSVAKLVKLRLTQVKLPALTEEKKEWEEARVGYEHQIDLLHSSVAKSKEDARQLNVEMDKKREEMRLAYLEFEDLRREYHRLEEDFAHAREENQKEMKQKEALHAEYQRTIAEQRMIIEKKQRYIAKLEGKVHDLMYEIRSLLQLEDMPTETTSLMTEEDYLPSSHNRSTPYDLSVLLHRFIEKAQNQTGMEHLGGKSPRFLDPSASYAVDQRRLFDCLRDETAVIVFILSLTEKKFLFVNQHVKTVLGWSPEKFMKEFSHLIVSGYGEWKKAVSHLPQESQIPLTIECKSGEKKECLCTMGKMTRGPFAHHILGILK